MKSSTCLGAVALLAIAAVLSPAQAQTKKELVQKLLQIQRPGIEAVARQLVETPAVQAAQGAANLLRTRVPADKREAAGKAADVEIKKYLDESLPLVRDKALQLANTTVGPLLEEKFTEDELRQLIAWIDSPLNKKYQQLGPELQNALAQKLVAESRPQIEPRIRAMEVNIAKALGVPLAPAAAPAAAASAPAAAKGR